MVVWMCLSEVIVCPRCGERIQTEKRRGLNVMFQTLVAKCDTRLLQSKHSKFPRSVIITASSTPLTSVALVLPGSMAWSTVVHLVPCICRLAPSADASTWGGRELNGILKQSARGKVKSSGGTTDRFSLRSHPPSQAPGSLLSRKIRGWCSRGLGARKRWPDDVILTASLSGAADGTAAENGWLVMAYALGHFISRTAAQFGRRPNLWHSRGSMSAYQGKLYHSSAVYMLSN